MDSAETRRPVIAPTTPEPPFDERLDRELDQALEDSFPASDPVAIDRPEASR